MYFEKTNYPSDLEILVTNANLVCGAITILEDGIPVDENGDKYVNSGSLIDATGAVITETGTVGVETLSATPVGVLYQSINVINGDEPGALIIEGYVRADRVLTPFSAAAIVLIKTALPNIKFR